MNMRLYSELKKVGSHFQTDLCDVSSVLKFLNWSLDTMKNTILGSWLKAINVLYTYFGKVSWEMRVNFFSKSVILQTNTIYPNAIQIAQTFLLLPIKLHIVVVVSYKFGIIFSKCIFQVILVSHYYIYLAHKIRIFSAQVFQHMQLQQLQTLDLGFVWTNFQCFLKLI